MRLGLPPVPALQIPATVHPKPKRAPGYGRPLRLPPSLQAENDAAIAAGLVPPYVAVDFVRDFEAFCLQYAEEGRLHDTYDWYIRWLEGKP